MNSDFDQRIFRIQARCTKCDIGSKFGFTCGEIKTDLKGSKTLVAKIMSNHTYAVVYTWKERLEVETLQN
jgi:hypothetical protein